VSDPLHHAQSSVNKWGGVLEDYLGVHHWFDEPKGWICDFRSRAIRHHAEGIAEAIKVLGSTITLSTCGRCGALRGDHYDADPLASRREMPLAEGFDHVAQVKLIPTRWVAEQHVKEDLGRIPTAAQWLSRIEVEAWMVRGAVPLSQILDTA
jgi:hypothetical protein